MPKLTIEGAGTFDVKEGTKLVLAIEDNGVRILHRCGGKARCTTCRVEIIAGEFCEANSNEKNAITEKGIEDYLRLSCQMHVHKDIVVRPILTVENSGLDAGPRPAE
ncbi:2Fe-2S iron-sulfur cluster-binding protein [Bacillus mobilis]|uniref:2Fe-2S iron-sulfur cluster-binding protein n=1 Tax=Bacillus mobilis TaxID=2026190 RepID=UPI000BEC86CF|nr:(2Fe-2S)-binding protein [Bacillus cereus]PFO74749.1 (2Fe-2S)-binding protein [Bacillus cereus]PFS81411.1 (2Fe-2S)-binding protein [Bacillus cereus]